MAGLHPLPVYSDPKSRQHYTHSKIVSTKCPVLHCALPKINCLRPNRCLIPYNPGNNLPSAEFGFGIKLDKKQVKAEQNHNRQQEKDASTLVEFLLAQWPCMEPNIAGFDAPVLIDIQKALELMRPEWLRLFQNFELTEYLTKVQIVLDKHRSVYLVQKVGSAFAE